MEPFVNATPGRYLCVGLPIDIDEPEGASAANNGRRAPWLPQALADLWAEQAASVYHTYLRYAGPGDIFVRSIGEHFIDAEAYLATTGAASRDLARELARTTRQNASLRRLLEQASERGRFRATFAKAGALPGLLPLPSP